MLGTGQISATCQVAGHDERLPATCTKLPEMQPCPQASAPPANLSGRAYLKWSVILAAVSHIPLWIKLPRLHANASFCCCRLFSFYVSLENGHETIREVEDASNGINWLCVPEVCHWCQLWSFCDWASKLLHISVQILVITVKIWSEPCSLYVFNRSGITPVPFKKLKNSDDM